MKTQQKTKNTRITDAAIHEISQLQALHDALYLHGGPVTWPDECRLVETSRPLLESWLDSHRFDGATADDATVAFLRYSLNLLYSTAFLTRHDQTFADRLIDYTSRTLDILRSSSDANTPQVAGLLVLEDELFQDA